MVLGGWFARALAPRAESVLVVNISSGAAKRAIAGWSAYCASKAGLDMGTRVAALEAAPNVAVCSLAPGVVDTPMQGVVRSADEQTFPDRARFQAMKDDGVLRPAADVAGDILAAIDAGKLTNGGNFDLREMA
jgi:NAD(P)-dependent dehydrogenase (short-subunit alcohol dehydrogenase family)